MAVLVNPAAGRVGGDVGCQPPAAPSHHCPNAELAGLTDATAFGASRLTNKLSCWRSVPEASRHSRSIYGLFDLSQCGSGT